MTNTPARTDLRPASGFMLALRQQLWLLGVSRRWAWTLGAMVGLLMFLHSVLPPNTSMMAIAAVLMVIVGSMWPLVVWNGEHTGRRGYLWSLPVPRPAHEIARVVAGAVFLVAIGMGLALAAAIARGGFGPLLDPGPQAWAYYFLGPLALYLLVTPPVLWSGYRITRWILGSYMAFGVLNLLFAARGYEVLGEIMVRVLFEDRWGVQWVFFSASDAISSGVADSSLRWDPVVLWSFIGVFLSVFMATFRPDDLKLLVRVSPGSPE